MKSLEEIRQISKTYSGGPILKVALEDAVRWIEAYREVAIEQASYYDTELQEDVCDVNVDAEAAQLLGEK